MVTAAAPKPHSPYESETGAVNRLRRIIIAVVVLIVLTALALLVIQRSRRVSPGSSPALTLSAPPPLRDDIAPDSLKRALDESLLWAQTQEPSRALPFGPVTGTVGDLIDTLTDFRTKVEQFGFSEELFQYLRENYLFLSSTAPSVMFTGYFEARLRGSRTRTGSYTYPLYRKPNDLFVVDLSAWSWLDSAGLKLPKTLRARLTPQNRLVPYYSRAEIDYAGALSGKGLEAIWVDDPIDAFFLHIQGSGVVTLPDGSTQRVGYAEKNGHPYRAIGNYLIAQERLEAKNVSAQTLKAYLRSHPDEVRDILSSNPSYVFFDLRERGPLGSLGTTVIGGRSIATDAGIFPHGALAFIETEKPVFDTSGTAVRWEKFGRFVLNQDTGGAIVGPGQVDLFTGFGDEAEATAGVMKQPGGLFFLLKKKPQPSP